MDSRILKVSILCLGLLIGVNSFTFAANRERSRTPQVEKSGRGELNVERNQLNRKDSRSNWNQNFPADFTVEQVESRPEVKVTNISRFRGPIDIELIVNKSWGGVHNRIVYSKETILPGEYKTYKINDEPSPGLMLTPMYSPYAFIVRIYTSSADHKLIKEYNPLSYFTVVH